MAENDTPTTPQPTAPSPQTAPAAPAPPTAPKKNAADYDRAHVPMGEEFDKSKWTLPPWQPVAIALAIVAIALIAVAYFNRAKPPASGGIDEVTAVDIPGDSVLVALNLHFTNTSEKPVVFYTVKAAVQTSKGEFSDNAANASDFQRYYDAYPALKQDAKTPLALDTRLPPGASASGTLMFGFPVPKDVFDSRQSLTVTIQPYNTPPIVLKK